MSKKSSRNIRNYQGTRDWSGNDARWREWVRDQIKSIFKQFGFEPLETPAIETIKTLKGKAGEETDTKFFRLSLPSPNEGGLRFDHTIPLARFTAMNWNQFPLPYRRYAIGPVWRNDKTQAGRYKEFWQCDFDTVGSEYPTDNRPPIVDASIVALKYTVFTQLGFPQNSFQIQINDRRLLNAMVQAMGITNPNQTMAVFRAWDKLKKISRQQINQELKDNNLLPTKIKLFNQVTDLLLTTDTQNQNPILTLFQNNQQVIQALQNIQRLLETIADLGVPTWAYHFNPLLARGLSYYTGPIFETFAGDKGSISGGGRFDNLIETLGGPNLPASGASFGLERVMAVMEDFGLRPESSQTTQVFVSIFDPQDQGLCKASLQTVANLRQAGFNTEIYTGKKQLGKQLTLANKKAVPLVLIIGPDELVKKKIIIKDLRSGKQQTVNRSQINIRIKQLLK